MLRLLKNTLLLVSCSVVLVNCADGELRKKVVDFMQRKVLLPSELVEVKNGYIYSAELLLIVRLSYYFMVKMNALLAL